MLHQLPATRIMSSPSGTTPNRSNFSPTSFFQSVLGRPVIVKLYSGLTYHGVLACLDGYMNIAMEQTQEYYQGRLTNSYADTFIRGNNILYIRAQ